MSSFCSCAELVFDAGWVWDSCFRQDRPGPLSNDVGWRSAMCRTLTAGASNHAATNFLYMKRHEVDRIAICSAFRYFFRISATPKGPFVRHSKGVFPISYGRLR